jgi:dienelactone hydrolase
MKNRRDFLLASAASGITSASKLVSATEDSVVVRDLELPTNDPSRALPVRIFAPATPKLLPVIAFSHGAYSSGHLYDPILRAWAQAGFAVLAPTHRDSVSLGVKRGNSDPRYFGWRLDDMESLLGSVDEIERRVPEFNRRLNHRRIAATGHSFGGLVAQTISCATLFDPVLGKTVARRAAQVRATVIFSGAGRFAPLLRGEDFAELKLPLLVTVGTEDLAQAPGLTGYQWRREPFDLAASKSRWLLTLRGADHYLGGLVGRDDLPKSTGGAAWLDAFNTVSVSFLRRYVAGTTLKTPSVDSAVGQLQRI